MPDHYFSRPCPVCGGRVYQPDGCDYAECTNCGNRFRLQATREETTDLSPKNESTEPKPIYTRFLAFFNRAGQKFGKASKPSKPQSAPEPPMDEGQRALYNARKKQLEAREPSSVPRPEPTKGERIEQFVTTHRVLSITLAAIVLVLLLTLLTVGITFCVKESRINKDDFTFIYGTEGIDATTDSRTYKFVTNNGKVLKINMNAIRDLCGLTISGTKNEPRYAVRGDPSYVRFQIGNKIAVVNGRNYEMSCPAEYDDNGDLWVDLYFINDILGGLIVTFDPETNTVEIRRMTVEGSSVIDPVYVAVSISASNRTEVSGSSGFSSEITYKTDVSAYIDDLYPEDTSYLILANKENPLTKDHAPSDLMALTVPTTKEIQLRASAARAIEALFAEMTADGITGVSITSGYRGYDYQEWLFNYYVEKEMHSGISYEEAVAIVETYSSRPGYSEHQTGLCVDFWVTGMTDLTNEQFEPTDASAWLMENAWKFGFILRYPEDKTDITGYSYESWHYRFVGVDAATEIYQNGQCFEEYIEKLS